MAENPNPSHHQDTSIITGRTTKRQVLVYVAGLVIAYAGAYFNHAGAQTPPPAPNNAPSALESTENRPQIVSHAAQAAHPLETPTTTGTGPLLTGPLPPVLHVEVVRIQTNRVELVGPVTVTANMPEVKPPSVVVNNTLGDELRETLYQLLFFLKTAVKERELGTLPQVAIPVENGKPSLPTFTNFPLQSQKGIGSDGKTLTGQPTLTTDPTAKPVWINEPTPPPHPVETKPTPAPVPQSKRSWDKTPAGFTPPPPTPLEVAQGAEPILEPTAEPLTLPPPKDVIRMRNGHEELFVAGHWYDTTTDPMRIVE